MLIHFQNRIILGPDAAEVPAKLDEMGKVIDFLNNELILKPERWKSGLPPLIVVLGDHGMADGGGHGGSSDSETLTPMIFISPKKLNQKSILIKQGDFVPTMAWLTGVPIPKNNLGYSMFKNIGANGFKYNIFQITKALKKDNFDLDYNLDDLNAMERDLFSILEKEENNLSNYNVPVMLLGIFISLMVIWGVNTKCPNILLLCEGKCRRFCILAGALVVYFLQGKCSVKALVSYVNVPMS